MWRQILSRASNNVDDEFDRLSERLKRRLGQEPLTIVPYRGFGTSQAFHLKGRVLEDKGLRPTAENDSVWQNLVAMYRRLDSDEVPNARVQVEFQGAVVEVVTDKEGYFDIDFRLPSTLNDQRLWQYVTLTMAESGAAKSSVSTIGQVLTPPVSSAFGVISDLDDTVLQTHATNLLKMARVTFLNNARTRLPFAGVAAFYRALQAGLGERSFNPIFYVSSSPWNLYDLLIDFLEVHEIPAGPLLLRDFSLSLSSITSSGHHMHKLKQIEQLFTAYPDLPFILIGDSGQHDPEIYHKAVHEFPGRVAAVYIRDVSLEDRDLQVDAIIEHMGTDKVPMLRVADTVAAAEHAAEQGFIAKDALAAIQVDGAEDKSAPGDVEQLLGE